MFGLGGTELLVVLGIVLLLFGATRIPQLARGLGQGIREFRKEIHAPADEGQQNTP
ncbi:MAG: twin-arginine translocase TatA/TatE family subunit [Verrucomicrobia bacterium]|nr:MAG: twin-arginine translocase TatA/TatE family subunit [Verrucomicrobiota bacterium]